MMKSIQYRKRHDISTQVGELCSLDSRNPLLDALMRAEGIEMRNMGGENRPEMVFTEDDDVVEALAPNSAKKSFCDRVHSGGTGGREHDFYIGPFCNPIELSAILGVSIPNQDLWTLPKRGGLA